MENHLSEQENKLMTRSSQLVAFGESNEKLPFQRIANTAGREDVPPLTPRLSHFKPQNFKPRNIKPQSA
jgi:hypothetical protein